MENKWVKKRHNFYFWFFSTILKPFFIWKNHLKYKRYKTDKNKNYFILSNHQTDLDPFFIYFLLRRNIYFVATENMYSSKFVKKFLEHGFSPIPIEKGTIDLRAIKKMIQIGKEGGNVLLFPEGNRTYAEFQFNIDESTVKLVRKMNLPLLLLNIKGGTGCYPRFANKRRKGPLSIEVKKEISLEELDTISDSDLLEIIKEDLRVYDSDEGNEYLSKSRAENIEEMLFVCPKCGHKETIFSCLNSIKCHNCDLNVEYTTRLTLDSLDKEFKFKKLVDWYNYQKEYVKNYELDDQIIFSDDDIKLYEILPNYNRKLIHKGSIKLYKDKLILSDKLVFNINDINNASPVGGHKMTLNINNVKYAIKGKPKFNPLKYVLMFNKLDTKMKLIDRFYKLD